MSINIEMEKEDVVHVCNRILFSHKKERNTVPFAEMWVDLETDVHKNEVRKKKKQIYINLYMWN